MNYKKIEQDYLTIKEVAKLTGKSEITIRRLIKNEPYQDSMQDSMQPNKLSRLLIKKEKTQRGFVYKVQKQFILDKIKLKTRLSDKLSDKVDDKVDDKVNDKAGDKVSGDKLSGKISNEIVLILKEQLQIKDKQIENLSRKIDELIERDRETNIILKGLQDKFFLLEAPKEEILQSNVPTRKTKEKKKSFLSLLLGW